MNTKLIRAVLALSLVTTTHYAFGVPDTSISGGKHPSLSPAHKHTAGRMVKHLGPVWTPFPTLAVDTADLPVLIKGLDSSDALQRARAAFFVGQVRYKDAIPKLVSLLSDSDPQVRTHAGIALACMADEKGIPECRAALDSDPDWVRFYSAYGLWCINTDASRTALSSVRTKQSRFIKLAILGAMSRRTIDLQCTVFTEPNHQGRSLDQLWETGRDDLVYEGDWWFHEGDYDQIIRCQEAALLLFPKDPDLYATNAFLLWSTGRNEEADSTLLRGVKANPKSWESHYELGEHYIMTKRYALAEPELRLSLKCNGPVLVRRSYAHCLEKTRKLKEALSQWEAIVKAGPKDRAAIVNRDRVKRLLGD